MFGSVSLQTVSCLSFIFYLYQLGSFQSLINVEKTCTFFSYSTKFWIFLFGLVSLLLLGRFVHLDGVCPLHFSG